MAYYDPITGKRRATPPPDTDPTGQYGGAGLYEAAPSGGGGGGFSPTGASSYSNVLNIAGTQPDFWGILNSDPILQGFKNTLGAESVADRSQLSAARQRALAQFGLVPDLSNSLGIAGSDLYEDITPETRALAETNTREGLSTVGRLNREFERVQQNIQDALAARGMLRSGATGIALKDLQQDRKVAMSDAQQQLLDYLQGVQSAYVQSQRTRAHQLAQEQAAAAGRIPADQLTGTPAKTATHIGGGIYEADDGSLWNADGTRYTGPDPRQQQQAQEPNWAELAAQAWQQQPVDPVPSRPAYNPVSGLIQRF